jgi:hypothetical protein
MSMRLDGCADQEHVLVIAVQTLSDEAGKKRAIIAVAHTLIVIADHLQKNKNNYDDLGGTYFDRIHSEGLKRYLVKRLQQLGHKVTLEPMEAPKLISPASGVFEGVCGNSPRRWAMITRRR